MVFNVTYMLIMIINFDTKIGLYDQYKHAWVNPAGDRLLLCWPLLRYLSVKKIDIKDKTLLKFVILYSGIL